MPANQTLMDGMDSVDQAAGQNMAFRQSLGPRGPFTVSGAATAAQTPLQQALQKLTQQGGQPAGQTPAPAASSSNQQTQVFGDAIGSLLGGGQSVQPSQSQSSQGSFMGSPGVSIFSGGGGSSPSTGTASTPSASTPSASSGGGGTTQQRTGSAAPFTGSPPAQTADTAQTLAAGAAYNARHAAGLTGKPINTLQNSQADSGGAKSQWGIPMTPANPNGWPTMNGVPMKPGPMQGLNQQQQTMANQYNPVPGGNQGGYSVQLPKAPAAHASAGGGAASNQYAAAKSMSGGGFGGGLGGTSYGTPDANGYTTNGGYQDYLSGGYGT